MGYRVFTDSKGTEWQAWDVVPQLAERREVERRTRMVPVPHADRRRSPDRRIIKGRRPILTSGLDGGWLCFEAEAEKRRLAPIPGDWLRCPQDRLEEYCRAARPAPRPSSAAELSDSAHFMR